MSSGDSTAMAGVKTSFVYEELVLHVQTLQKQMIEIMKYIHEQCKDKANIPRELESRSFTLIDPYGNAIKNHYMDHEVISAVFKNFKKEYVPKYLQKWIQLGRIEQGVISPLSEHELSKCVSDYDADSQFVTYVGINLVTKYCEGMSPIKSILPVLLTDSIEKIKKQIQNVKRIKDIQLSPFVPNPQNSDEVQTFRPEDTVLSTRLYDSANAILVKVVETEVKFIYTICVNVDYFSF